MATAQLSLARCSARTISSRQVVGPRRLSAAVPARRLICKASVVEASSKEEKKSKREEEDEDDWEGSEDDGLTPQQVESLLSVLCEETDIAEVELKMGSFKMRVRRSLSGSAGGPAVHQAAAPAAAPAPAAYAPAPAAAPAASVASVETDEDESLLDVTANKVGILRRGRYLKGKQVGKGEMIKVGDQVKKGQTVAFIEQLGTHWPLEAQQAGEVVEFLVAEGEPVEYKQPVMVIAPYFGVGSPGYAP